jgi:ABC-type lipoprotein release transport system permease subunit
MAIAILVIFLCSIVAVDVFGRSKTISIKHQAMVGAFSVVDTALSVLLLSFLPISNLSLTLAGIVLGLVSLTGFQAILIPQRQMVWRVAFENIRRRKRQATLLVAGFIISSAILSSSFIIGDSLDATIAHEVESTWTNTDILISGFNPNTGTSVTFSEELADRFWQQSMNESTFSESLEGRMHGITSTVSALGPTGLGIASASLFANNATLEEEGHWPAIGDKDDGIQFATLELLNLNKQDTPFIVVNDVFAEELDVGENEIITLTIFRDDAGGGGRERVYRDAVVYSVASMEGYAQRGGTMQPAVFIDLPTAQEWLNMPGQVTRVEYSFVDDTESSTISKFADSMESQFDQSVLFGDIGLLVNEDDASGGITISSERDLGRINATIVERLREDIRDNTSNVAMLEAILAPIVSVEHQGNELLSLSNTDLLGLEISNDSLWHWSNNGFGFESFEGEDVWLWMTSENDVVHDAALGVDGIAVAASSSGFVFGNELQPNTSDPTIIDDVGDAVSILYHTSLFYGIAEFDGEYTLYEMNQIGSIERQLSLSGMIGTSVLDATLYFGTNLYLEIETLIEAEWYKIELDPILQIQRLSSQPVLDNGGGTNIQLHDVCDGKYQVQEQNNGWCSTDFGLAKWNLSSQVLTSIRLPVLSEIAGAGTLPQLILAFDGDERYTLQPGALLTTQPISELMDATNSSSLAIHGAIPFAFGNSTPVVFDIEGHMQATPGFENLTSIEEVFFGLASIHDVETLALAQQGERTLLMLSSNETSLPQEIKNQVNNILNEQSTMDNMFLQVSAVKINSIEAAKESSALLSGMFVVFGSFTIAAGMLLTITILLLLFEVRKNEVATLRALGLRQADARALFFFEGMVLATIGGAIGAVFGGVLAWFVGAGFAQMFASVGAIGFRYDWSLDSIVLGWCGGSILSFIVLWCLSWWNARLNIVKTLRDLHQFVLHQVPWYLYLIQGAALGGLILFGFAFILLGEKSGFASTLVLLLGISFFTILIPFIFWELPIWFRSKQVWKNLYRNASRNTVGGLGLTYLLWSMLYVQLNLSRNADSDELALILRGLVQVIAGVLLLSSLAPLALNALLRFAPLSPRKRLLSKVALSHPLAHPVRTAAVVGMFSLTMFSVIVLAGYTSQFDNFSTQFVEEAEGDYEILLTSSRARPLDLPPDVLEWNLTETAGESIDSVARIYRAPVHIEDDSGERMPYIIRGFDENFSNHGGLPLHIWDEQLGETAEEAWISIKKYDDIVFVDASFGLELATDGTGLNQLKLSIGDLISLIDFSNPENRRIVRVGGFLAQSSYLYSAGIWINSEVAVEQFDAKATRMYISVSEGSTDGRIIQGKSEIERQRAEMLSEELNQKFSSEGVQVTLIYEDIQTLQQLVQSLLGLFEGYLSIGLFVGVTGIGVVTYRNVSERRSSIGMMRALGLRRNEVGLLFVVEVSWIAVLGLLNGFVIAYLFHSSLYETIWSEQGVEFSFPHMKSFFILASSWALVILTTMIPIRNATKISPIEAQND